MNLKPYSRGLLTTFGLLDALLLGLSFGNVVSADLIPGGLPVGAAALQMLKGLLMVTLIFTAIGLCWERRWAMLLSCIQFPLRLIYPAMLSFVFLGQIPGVVKLLGGSLLIVQVVLELVRLVITIQLMRGGGKR